MHELNVANFKNNISKGFKLVEFYTTWCSFCKKQRPVLEEIDSFWIGTIDAEDSPSLVNEYKINGYPTFILFNNGKEVDRFVGLHSKFELINKILKFLNDSRIAQQNQSKRKIADIETVEDF